MEIEGTGILTLCLIHIHMDVVDDEYGRLLL
jgi:hypothetical protein